jgi:hypothetical protein
MNAECPTVESYMLDSFNRLQAPAGRLNCWQLASLQYAVLPADIYKELLAYLRLRDREKVVDRCGRRHVCLSVCRSL